MFFGERQGVSPMALDSANASPQCRLLLRKSRVAFAERKTTLCKSSAIGRQPSVSFEMTHRTSMQNFRSRRTDALPPGIRAFCPCRGNAGPLHSADNLEIAARPSKEPPGHGCPCENRLSSSGQRTMCRPATVAISFFCRTIDERHEDSPLDHDVS